MCIIYIYIYIYMYTYLYIETLTWAFGTAVPDDAGQYAYTYICKHTLYLYVYSIYMYNIFTCVYMHMYIHRRRHGLWVHLSLMPLGTMRTHICKHTLYMYVYSIYISHIYIYIHMYICSCIYTGADMGCGYTSR